MVNKLMKKVRIPSNIKSAEEYYINFCKDIELVIKDIDVQDNIKLAYCELISNAIIYGNKEIEYKKVYCSYSIEDNIFKCIMEDDGDGFDYKARLCEADIIADVLLEHGRGIKLMCKSMDIVKYSNDGKTCYMEKRW